MTLGLKRFHHSRQSHFLTFSCYQRRPYFNSPNTYDLFLACLEQTRQHFDLCVYGYVLMPDHVHILLNEPPRRTLADAVHALKLSFSKRMRGHGTAGPFWQKRYYDRNVRDEHEFKIKLRYMHRNPVKRGLVNEPREWKWSSFRHYSLRELGAVKIESEWTARDREAGALPRTSLIPG